MKLKLFNSVGVLSAITYSPCLRQLSLVNARIGYEWKQVGIDRFVNNLLDKEHITTAFTGFLRRLASYGDRRTFGFQVRSTF